MPLEEILRTVLGGIARLIIGFFVQIFFEIVCYWIGRIFLLIVAFGTYDRLFKKNRHESLVSLVGFVVLATALFIINN